MYSVVRYFYFKIRSPSVPFCLTAAQQQIVAFPAHGGSVLWVTGPAGCGKSAALHERLASLLRAGERPSQILVLVPQRAQGARYEQHLALLDAPTRGGCDLVTFYGLTRRALALFWPLVSDAAGFARPHDEPTFLTIESTQYYMWQLVAPLIAQDGYFRDVAIRRERLLSQLVDNLNKSALVGFAHTEIQRRLQGAWTGEAQRLITYHQAQECASRFRQYCLQHNLLDFSLVTELFTRHLLPHPLFARYCQQHYRHLLVDDLEENVPAAHRFVRWAAGQVQSTVLASDPDGGLRVFLGADAAGAAELQDLATQTITLDEPVEGDPGPRALAQALRRRLHQPSADVSVSPQSGVAGQSSHRLWVEMIRWVATTCRQRLAAGTNPHQIAIIAPYVNEVMRFAIQEELRREGLSLFLLRPSSPLVQDPVVRAVITLGLLAHPDWELAVQDRPWAATAEDVALALQVALARLDPVRAHLLATAALSPANRALLPVDDVALGQPRLWERVGYQVREHYGRLQQWLEEWQSARPQPFDIFCQHLFGDLLSTSGFGLFQRPDLARAFGRLAESAYQFAQAVGQDRSDQPERVARDHLELVLGGMASANYMVDWPQQAPSDAVVLAPAYSYLTRDLCSDYQFWLDLGSDGWWSRPNQPLTQPYVLSDHWVLGQPWRDIEEQQASRTALARILTGLAARCRQGIYLGYSELGLDGREQQGQLHRVVMSALSEGAAHG
jgi:glutathione S-transferase